MAFNINAHVILSGPKNIKAVTKRIQTQLGSVNARINLVAPKNLSKQLGSFNKGLNALNKNITTLQSSAASANAHLQKLGAQFRSLNKASAAMAKSQASVQKSLANTGKQVHQVGNEIQAFGKDAALAIRRFAAFTVATGVIFGFVRAIQTATKAAIAYEREIVKIVQVTGASAVKIDKLNKTISQLSVSLGVDANELAELGRIFAQTGQSIDQVGDSIRAIARSSLAPSFGSMKSTAEGLIAAMAQFNIKANESEAVLASLNAVSKKWAVEAEDMISVIRRAGGVFAASAGQMDDPKKALNELIGIFVAVRSTTRESADTIAVGLRTIFTRIQRRGTIEFLRQFNIELVDVKGNFIGLFPAFQELSRGLSDIIRKGDALTLSAITEELGGVRQVGKLIPAITQFNKALAATKVAGEAAAKGMGKDVALALQPLGKQFELLQQRFNALVRDITQTKTFQNMAKIALSMANAFLSVAETLKPLIPLMTTFAAIKMSRALFDFGTGFIGGIRKGGGAGGAGGALGGAVTGAPSGGTARSISAQQALTVAIKSHSLLLSSNNTALKQLGTQVASNTTAITTTGGKVAASSTQIIGAMGGLINALNRKALGGLGGGKKFARGGYVSGPSHSQGGVPAVLEGGEYVIPKTQYHAGKKAGTVTTPKTRRKKAATGDTQLDINPSSKSANIFMLVREEGNPTDQIPNPITIAKPKLLSKDDKTKLGKAGVTHFGFSAPLKISGFSESKKMRDEEKLILDQIEASVKTLQASATTAGAQGSTGTNLTRSLDSIKKHFNVGFGRIFEEYVNSVANITSGGVSNFDIQQSQSKNLTPYTKQKVPKDGRGEIKLSDVDKLRSDVIKKAVNENLFAGVIKKRLAKSQNKSRPQKKSRPKKKSRGGIVYMQGGGLIHKNQVGAALLEDIGSLTSSVKVSPADVNLQGKSTAGFPKDKRVGPSFLKGPKAYHLTKQGLDGKRSREFTSTLMTNLRGAAENSAQALGADLGLNTVVPDNVIGQFESSINKGAIGSLFEDTIKVLNGPPFNTDTGAPFDFSTGLAAGLIDDFNKLTMTYVDAKKSKANATDAALKTKISSQLAREAITSGGLISETGAQRKTRVTGEARAHAQRKGKRFAAGGNVFAPQGTDTVPAMLTPGEFVVNKKSAQSFGYGNLKKINSYGKGGSVGVPRKKSAPVKKKAKDKKKFVEKSRFMTMNMATGGQDGDDWKATFVGTANAPAEISRGKKILGMNGYLDFDAASTEFGLHVTNTDTLSIPTLKGQGYGSAAYKKLYDWTVQKQIGFYSDGQVTTSAAKVWRGLKKNYGIPVKQMTTNIKELDLDNQGAVGPDGKFTAKGEKRLVTNDPDVDGLFGVDFMAAGGSVGTDTVPAMLTPGEFVVNRKSAENFGYGNLKKINSYSKGGVAATGKVQYLEDGTGSDKASKAMGIVFGIQMAVGALAGFTTALASFDLDAPLVSMTALGMAAMQAAGSFAMLAPGLSQTIMASQGVSTVMNTVKGQFKEVTQPFKSASTLARRTYRDSRAGGSFGDRMAGKTLTPKSVTKSLSAGSGKFFRSMGTSLPRLLKGVFTGIPGLITAFLIGPLTNAISDFFLGKKTEIAPGVKGRSDVSVGQAVTAGGLSGAATGAVTGAAIASMIPIPVISTGVGLIVGAIVGGISGMLKSGLAQAEFLAFETLQASAKALGESFENLAKLGDNVNTDALAAMGAEMAKNLSNLSGAFEAGSDRRNGWFGNPFSNTGEAKNYSASLQASTDQISPATLQAMDKSIQDLLSRATSEMGRAGDTASLQSLAGMETVSADPTDLARNAQLVNDSYKTLGATLQSTAAGTEGWAKELDHLLAQSLKIHLMKDVADQLKILGEIDPKKSKKLALQFYELNDSIDFSKASVEDIDAAIAELGSPAETAELRKIVNARKEDVAMMADQAATQELIHQAARASRKALDALVAGLERFGERTKGIAVQTSLFADELKTAFNEITGEATIGKLQKFNPFENLAAATDTQIDTGISEMKDFGGAGPAGDAAFKGIGDMLKAGRDFPLAMRDIVNKIDKEESDTGVKLDNQQVLDMIKDGFGGALPENMLTAVGKELEAGVGRQGGKAFSSDQLEEMFEENGKINEILGKAFNATVKEMAGFDATVVRMKNSLMEVARIQEQMAKHRLSAELSMLDKQEAIRDRVNNALGTGTDAFAQATDDLQKRVTTQLSGGLKPGQGVVPVGGNVLDPEVLFERLKTLDQKRAVLKGQAGTGSADDIRNNSDMLGKLNREMEGTEAALRTLANDTRKLAAIESKIAEQQSRKKGAEGTVDSILDGLDKFMRGEISGAEFSKQITQPLTTVNKAFDKNQSVNFTEGMDLIRRIKSGDPLVAGHIQSKTEELAKQRGVSLDDSAGMRGIRQETLKNLSINLAGKGTALAKSLGIPNLAGIIEQQMSRMFEAENQAEILGAEMRDVGAQQVSIMQKMLEREEALMASTLHASNQEFNTAVNSFQEAVTEFALMRGGLSEADMTSVAADVQKSKDAEIAAGSALESAKQGQGAAIKQAGDEAAANAAAEAVQRNLPAEVAQKHIKAAREEAEAEKTRTTNQGIAQKKSAFDKATANRESKEEFQTKMQERHRIQASGEQQQQESDAASDARVEATTQEVAATQDAGERQQQESDAASDARVEATTQEVAATQDAAAGEEQTDSERGWFGAGLDALGNLMGGVTAVLTTQVGGSLTVMLGAASVVEEGVRRMSTSEDEAKLARQQARLQESRELAFSEGRAATLTPTLRQTEGGVQFDASGRAVDPLAGKTETQLAAMTKEQYDPTKEGLTGSNYSLEAGFATGKTSLAAGWQAVDHFGALVSAGEMARNRIGEELADQQKEGEKLWGDKGGDKWGESENWMKVLMQQQNVVSGAQDVSQVTTPVGGTSKVLGPAAKLMGLGGATSRGVAKVAPAVQRAKEWIRVGQNVARKAPAHRLAVEGTELAGGGGTILTRGQWAKFGGTPGLQEKVGSLATGTTRAVNRLKMGARTAQGAGREAGKSVLKRVEKTNMWKDYTGGAQRAVDSTLSTASKLRPSIRGKTRGALPRTEFWKRVKEAGVKTRAQAMWGGLRNVGRQRIPKIKTPQRIVDAGQAFGATRAGKAVTGTAQWMHHGAGKMGSGIMDAGGAGATKISDIATRTSARIGRAKDYMKIGREQAIARDTARAAISPDRLRAQRAFVAREGGMPLTTSQSTQTMQAAGLGGRQPLSKLQQLLGRTGQPIDDIIGANQRVGPSSFLGEAPSYMMPRTFQEAVGAASRYPGQIVRSGVGGARSAAGGAQEYVRGGGALAAQRTGAFGKNMARPGVQEIIGGQLLGGGGRAGVGVLGGTINAVRSPEPSVDMTDPNYFRPPAAGAPAAEAAGAAGAPAPPTGVRRLDSPAALSRADRYGSRSAEMPATIAVPQQTWLGQQSNLASAAEAGAPALGDGPEAFSPTMGLQGRKRAAGIGPSAAAGGSMGDILGDPESQALYAGLQAQQRQLEEKAAAGDQGAQAELDRRERYSGMADLPAAGIGLDPKIAHLNRVTDESLQRDFAGTEFEDAHARSMDLGAQEQATPKPGDARPTGVDSKNDMLDKIQEWEKANLEEGHFMTSASSSFLNWLGEQEGYEDTVGVGQDKEIDQFLRDRNKRFQFASGSSLQEVDQRIRDEENAAQKPPVDIWDTPALAATLEPRSTPAESGLDQFNRNVREGDEQLAGKDMLAIAARNRAAKEQKEINISSAAHLRPENIEGRLSAFQAAGDVSPGGGWVGGPGGMAGAQFAGGLRPVRAARRPLEREPTGPRRDATGAAVLPHPAVGAAAPGGGGEGIFNIGPGEKLPSRPVARAQASMETIEGQRPQQQVAGRPAGSPRGQQEPAAAGGNLEELLRGTKFAETVRDAFDKGGAAAADQIKAALVGVIPPIIQMKAELGAITVKIVGGEVLQKWSDGVVERMKGEITTAIRTQVIPSALNKAEGNNGQNSGNTGYNQKNPNG